MGLSPIYVSEIFDIIKSINKDGTTVLLVEQNAKKAATKTVTFNVSMHCKNCVKKINDNVAFEKGVKDLSVSLDSKTVTVTYDPARTDVAKLKAALEKLGYKVTVQES